MSVAAVIVAQQRKTVRAFLARECTELEKARTLDELGVRQNLVTRRLIADGVLRPADGDRYWLDVPAWERLSARRRKLALVLLALGAVAVTIMLLSQ